MQSTDSVWGLLWKNGQELKKKHKVVDYHKVHSCQRAVNYTIMCSFYLKHKDINYINFKS